MTAKPPPVPRENQTDKGPGGAPRAPKDTTKHDPAAKRNLPAGPPGKYFPEHHQPGLSAGPVMPRKHPTAARVGGPGASHENRKQPAKSKPRGPHPLWRKSTRHAGVSGGGGEPDSHHSHEPKGKAGK